MKLKRILLASVVVLLSCVTNAGNEQKSYKAYIDGISYNLYENYSWEERTAVVTGGGGSNCSIPQSVSYNGMLFNVVSINGWGGESIFVPKYIKSAGDYVFIYDEMNYNFYNIECECNPFSLVESIVVEEGHPYWSSRDCNAIICGSVFEYGCKNSIIPDNVTTLGDYAFFDCKGLTSITLHSNIKSVGEYSFKNSGLEEITIENPDFVFPGFNKYFFRTFEGCEKLATININCSNIDIWFSSMNTIRNIRFLENVTTIADGAFSNCKNIEKIVFGKSISAIGERAFANIDKLTDVVCYAVEVPDADRTSFENSYIDYVTLHVPAGSVDKYKAIGPWKDFKDIVAIEGTEPISVETCVMPTISFLDGKLKFESGTVGSECHYEIKVEDAKEGVGSEVILSSAYEISVYASKEGYNDSEKNTATLYWINVDPITTGVIENEMRVNTNAILVQNTGGAIAISGVADGDNVLIYNISGQLIAQGKVSGNHVEIGTKLSSGDICIIKIGDKSVKYILR